MPKRKQADLGPLASILYASRRRLGLQQDVWARIFGVHVSTVRHWEHGRAKPPVMAWCCYQYFVLVNPKLNAGVMADPDLAALIAEYQGQ